MKTLLLSIGLTMTVVLAGVAVARTARAPSDAEVEAAIDARLHVMLVKLNAEKK